MKNVLQLANDNGYIPFFKELFNFSLDYTSEQKIMELSLLTHWLRKEHKFFVTVTIEPYQPDKPAYCADCLSISSKNMGERIIDGFTFYGTFEEALIEGIEESIKLIQQ